MATNDRLKRDIFDVRKCNTERCGIAVCIESDLTEFDAFIKGPEDSPYAGGQFKVHVSIPSEYPLKPPIVTFLTKVWHPNISSVSGYICLDVLGSKWPGSMNLRGVLISVQNLLLNPEKDDPQDHIVGMQACRNEDIFIKTAQQWTNFYAGGATCHDHLEKRHTALIEMGYKADKALYALSERDWDVDEAVEKLLLDDSE